MSATRLAEEVGYKSYEGVNAQYGRLADKIASRLAVDLSGHARIGILVEFVDPGHAANEHWLWVMRPHVAQALEDLGWARRVSHLLYPDLALAVMNEEAPVAVFDLAKDPDSDRKFWAWYDRHRDGFGVYLNKHSSKRAMLHDTTCDHLSEDEPGSATRRPKICCSSPPALYDCAAEQGIHVDVCLDCIG